MRKIIISLTLVVIICIGFSLQALAGSDMCSPGRFNTVSVGANHGAAISTSGDLYTWGNNKHGQLGVGDFNNRTTPTKVPGLKNVVAVSLGGYSSAAITENGDLYLWGVIINSAPTHTPEKVQNLANVVGVSMGGNHYAAITTSGDLYIWGSNSEGELGLGDAASRDTPTKVSGLTSVVAVSLGSTHSMAITADGSLFTWGFNRYGQLGQGHRNNINTPTKVQNLPKVTAICAGGGSSSALVATGDLFTWGHNSQEQLGYKSDTSFISASGGLMYYTDIPAKVPNLTNVVAFNMGGYHGAAVTANGQLFTWGDNYYGELGRGEHASPLPMRVQDLANVISVSLFAANSAALTDNGDLFIWGANEESQSNDGLAYNRSKPVKLMSNVRLPGSVIVQLNGRFIASDVPPQVINGRTMLPLRAIFEAMGASVQWNGATQTVTATKGDTVVVMTIGNTSPTVNGKVVSIDQPACIVRGRTLAPLRFVAEAFGGNVEWNGATRIAKITS